MKRLLVILLLPVSLAVLVGCTPSQAPVVDYYGGDRESYRVREGDTLFSIAWRHGYDYRELAAANDIDPPYTIHPGQVISLDTASPASRQASAPPASADEDADPGSEERASEAASTARAPTADTSPPADAGDLDWQWPVNGEILSSFSADEPGRGGITIAGSRGDPVRAAEAGVVVYRGSGLTGYGNLIILKHDDHWLSAYAHNDELLVQEGEQVDRGDSIARVGATGTYRTQLRFEIRRDGEPRDPVSLLPEQ